MHHLLPAVMFGLYLLTASYALGNEPDGSGPPLVAGQQKTIDSDSVDSDDIDSDDVDSDDIDSDDIDSDSNPDDEPGAEEGEAVEDGQAAQDDDQPSDAQSDAASSEARDQMLEALERKLNARSLADLERVVQLCESALAEGLEPADAEIARQLAANTLYEHASRLSREIFDRQPPNRQWRMLRGYAIRDLEKALTHEPNLGAAHLLIARLHAIPGGDRDEAERSLQKALELIKDHDELASQAYAIRAELTDQVDEKLADFSRAIELDPQNTDAWRGRGLAYLSQGDHESALDDLMKLLEQNPEDPVTHQAVAEVLSQMQQYEKALEHVDQVIAQRPESSLPWLLRARIHLAQENSDQAIDDLDRALELNPRDVNSLMLRAVARARQEDYDQARADVNRALEIEPNLSEAIQQRSLILAAQGKFAEAIEDMSRLIRAGADNPTIRLQLAYLYVSDHQPRRAIDVLSELLGTDPDHALALRARADAYLSVGQQAEAIADYEKALQQRPEDSAILNNLAWVLATSPDQQLRDGQRAIELATKACELTDFQQAHILSTLAAGYAEVGDYETAVKWSEEAVELGDDLGEQLEQELESYRQQKPWREVQQVEEKPQSDEASAADLELR